jgi:hypothetical protein
MAGLLDLLSETACREIALNAETARDRKGVGGRGVCNGSAAPQRHCSKLFEGAFIETNEFGLEWLCAHGDPDAKAWWIDPAWHLKLIMNAAMDAGKLDSCPTQDEPERWS